MRRFVRGVHGVIALGAICACRRKIPTARVTLDERFVVPPDVSARSSVGSPDAGAASLRAWPARPMAPLSGSALATRRPRFRWKVLRAGARIELTVCRDPACERPLQTLHAGESAAPGDIVEVTAAELEPGGYTWRLRAEGGVGPMWRFVVRRGATATDRPAEGRLVDFNDDGYADLAAGTSFEHKAPVRVWPGGPGGLVPGRMWRLHRPRADVREYTHPIAAGDLDGNGFGDLAIADELSGFAFVWPGSARGFYLSPSGPEPMRELHAPPSMDGGMAETTFGLGGDSGDLNGDGFSDLVISDPSRALTHVYHGGPRGIGAAPDVSIVASGPFQQAHLSAFAFGVASVGDTDGDGFGDLAIGERTGAIPTLFLGGPEGVEVSRSCLLRFDAPPRVDAGGDAGDAPYARIGAEVAAAGDFNGDGAADITVTVEDDPRCLAYVVLGHPRACRAMGQYGSLPSALFRCLSIPQTGSPFVSRAVHVGAGDVDRDGYSDVAVSSDGRTALVVYFGGPGERFRTQTFETPELPGVRSAAAQADDFNGDGFADVALSLVDDLASGIWVWNGSPSGLDPNSRLTLTRAHDYGYYIALRVP